ncbi:uncharacterized protein LOC122315143 isoform X1 [Carya illinoinensis]|uniref:Homeodomain-like superfamily protein n=1 Tax=Carya illinoinensis TaxID=32201 RepID=A0A8T1Q3T2_CARIL|nr:uncharacterized protein LOC122315143 isoform X1 [Carya illinoinensis]KAG6648717.1 hypothetical protein CIPAW_07G165000 [Carya illinoinensis]
MLEKTKKVMKGSVSEEDISTLLQRYTATTVLTLLQEVAHCPDVKIDWNTLVKNTSTGISDAREYQMLWHHLAYRHALLGKLEYGASPLDDDSDLEYEVQAFPTVSSEDLTEAAACVKVLVASGLPSESNLPASSIVEAPLTINIPNGPSSRASTKNLEATCSMQGMNITVPVSLQKLPLPAATPAEGLDANGSASGSMPPRRKRKPWSEAEDMELIAAVQKCGEGNWANILRGDFKGDRTASQLSQRWAIIRKRRGKLNVGPNYSGSQLSEARRAAHHAMSLALDMPVKNLAAARPAGTNTPSNSVLPPISTASGVIQAQDQTQEGCDPTKSSPIGSLGAIAKSRVSSIKPSTKPTIGSDSALRATAVAAGARIISPSDAASFFKVTQAKSVVHLKPTGSSSTKLPMPSGMSLQSGTQSNVHFVCAGPEAKPCSSHAGMVTNMVALPTVLDTPSAFATSSNMSSEQTDALISSLPSEVLPTQEMKTTEEIKVSTPVYSPKKEVLEDGSCGYQNVGIEQVKEDRALSPDMDAESKKQRTDVKNPDGSLNTKTAESDRIVVDNQAEARQIENDNVMMGSPVRGNNHSALEVNCENQGTHERCADSSTTISDGCGEKLEVMCKNEAGNEIEGEDNVK